MPDWQRLQSFGKMHALLIQLLMGTILGSIFIFLIPPWMHYDEPGHFEYAWLAANHAGWPERDEYDQAMRRAMGASMLEHDFQEYHLYQLLKTDQPISVITTQTGDLPLYYFLVSIPLRAVKYTDITFQLYLARFVSLFLFLLTIFFAYKASNLIFGKDHPLTWMVPSFLVFLPSFVDIMTAVNNDVAAIAAFSFFVWRGIKLIKEGFTVKNGAFLLISVVLCIFSKSTAWLSVPLALLVLFMSIFKGRSLKLLSAIIGFLVIMSAGLLFSWKETAPAYFYAGIDQNIPIRKSSENAPLGQFVIVQNSTSQRDQGFNYDLIPADYKNIDGKQVTFGAWIWAETPLSIRSPKIYCNQANQIGILHNEPIILGTEPEFFAFSATLPETGRPICWLHFFALKDPGNHVYWDGIILAQGQYPAEALPEFSDPDGRSGQWGGKRFENLVRNGSGEHPWPVFSTLGRKIIPSNLNYSASRFLSLLDFRTHAWYFRSTGANMFRTFWAVFGWGKIYLIGKRPFWWFAAFSIMGLIGISVGFFKKSLRMPRNIVIFLIISAISQGLLVLVRGVGSWYWRIFIPGARYFYPAIIPVAILFVWGIYSILITLHQRVKVSKSVLYTLYGCVLIGMIAFAIISITVNMI